MTLLLDTQILLWLARDDPAFGPIARARTLENRVFVSAINIWEISIKQSRGRLDATGLQELLEQAGFPELPLTSEHGRKAGFLPDYHRDPFDRALVAQAQVEGLRLVTADRLLFQYDVALLDASH